MYIPWTLFLNAQGAARLSGLMLYYLPILMLLRRPRFESCMIIFLLWKWNVHISISKFWFQIRKARWWPWINALHWYTHKVSDMNTLVDSFDFLLIRYSVGIQNTCRFQFRSNSIVKVRRCHGLVKFIRSSWFVKWMTLFLS